MALSLKGGGSEHSQTTPTLQPSVRRSLMFRKDEIMAGSESELVFVFMPEPLGPMDRGDKHEDPIIDDLERSGLGEVTGGDTGMGDEGPDGRREIQSCGIDVETTNVNAARETLRELLPKLGCQAGTQLHYSVAEKALQDEYDGESWQVEQERAGPAPDFYIGRSG